MCACTTPSNASSSASTATMAWQKNPGVCPSPAGPSPRRPRSRPLKLISVVSWAATIRRPIQADAVRICRGLQDFLRGHMGKSRNRCADISPARSPPTWRNTNDPVSTTRSNKAAPAFSRRTSPKKPMRKSSSPAIIPPPKSTPRGSESQWRNPWESENIAGGFLTTGAKSVDDPNQSCECRSRESSGSSSPRW